MSTARARFVRITPRKLRVVAALIRGRTLEQALHILQNTPKHGSLVLWKLLKSAQAGAAQKSPNVQPASLRISALTIDGGPSLKRWLPRAHGRATPILKRSAHAKVELEEVK